MKILYIHPNFPAQFRHTATALAADPANEVLFLTENARPEWNIKGVRKVIYQVEKSQNDKGYPSNETKKRILAGKAVMESLSHLKKKGFKPDLIVGHSGWGTTLFIKDVFPEVPFFCYFEWFYHVQGSNLDFDPDSQPTLNTALNIRLRNTFILNDLNACDSGLSPTAWQKKQLPEIFHDKVHCIHDGIDTNYFCPTEKKGLILPGLDLGKVKKIVTYTARGFEPYRGFPQFIEALPKILDYDKDCHVVIVGDDRVCYGEKRKDGKTYKKHMLEKVDFDRKRVHFVGSLPYGDYLKVLQQSAVHVYLSYPFVLSWSLLEAMACGCVIVASNTPPVREVIQDGVNGIFAEFFSAEDIASKVAGILTYPTKTVMLGQRARATIEEQYSLSKLLPKHLELYQQAIEKAKQDVLFGP